MSYTMQVFSNDQLQSLTLAQFISPKQKVSEQGFAISLKGTELHIEENCQTLLKSEHNKPTLSARETSVIELVVFSDLPVLTLQTIVTDCELTLLSLANIVNRNNQTSYRFAVEAQDLTISAQALAAFTSNSNIEAALIKNAPSLDTPGVLVMDMDSTVIEIECIDEIAALAGVGEQVAEVTELAMQGKLDFAQSLHQRVATLAGAPESILEEVASNIPLMAGLEPLVNSLHQHQWRVAIASGGFTYFADHLKALLSLDAAFANQLEIVDGKLTGKVLGNVVDAQAKADCLLKLAEQFGADHTQTVAMGDGANDLVMMKAANLGVAFHAKDIVKKQASTTINQAGLDCLLHWLK